MKKVFLWLSILFGLAILALVLVLFNLSPIIEKAKPQLEAFLEKKTGSPASFESIEASIFPSPGIKLKNATLGMGGSSAQIGEALLEADLKPLFGGEISVSAISLKDAKIVADLDSLKAQSEGKAASDKSSPEGSEAGSNLNLNIAAVDLDNIDIEVKGLLKNAPLVVSNLGGRITDIDPNQGAIFDIGASLLGKGESQTLRASGQVRNLAEKKAIPDLNSKINLSELSIEALLKLAKSFGVKDLPVTASGPLSGDLEVTSKNANISGTLDLNLSSSALSMDKTFRKPAGQTLRAKTGFGLNQGVTSLKNTSIKLGDTEVNLAISGLPANLKIDKLSSPGISLEELGKNLPALSPYKASGTVGLNLSGINPKNKTASGTIRLKDISALAPAGEGSIPVSIPGGKISLSGKALKSEGIELNVLSQNFKVKADVANLNSPKPKLEVSSQRLDLESLGNELKKAGLMKEVPEALKSSYINAAVINVDVDVGKKVNDISLTGGETRLMGITSPSLSLKASQSPKGIKLSSLNLSPFSGKVAGDAFLGDRIDAKLRTENINTAELFAALMPKQSIKLESTENRLGVNISTLKASPKRALGGVIGLDSKSGTIKGVNIFGQTLDKIGIIPGLGTALSEFIPAEHAEIVNGADTPFDSLKLDTAINSGRASIKEFSLRHALYSVFGDGSLDVVSGDMKINGKLAFNQGLAENMMLKEPKLQLLMDRQGSLIVPIQIRKKGQGRTLVIPDIKDLTKRATRNTAEEAVRKELDRVVPGLGNSGIAEGAGQLIEGIFN